MALFSLQQERFLSRQRNVRTNLKNMKAIKRNEFYHSLPHKLYCLIHRVQLFQQNYQAQKMDFQSPEKLKRERKCSVM